jgi:site-specific DNA-methyltransferase (adenine-specific)
MLIERLLGEDRRAPDILECLSNLSSDEVFTPPPVAGRMLDLLPDDVWSNPDLKWLDPSCKTGIFLREVASRLMDGLVPVIEDEEARRLHIFENMLYGIAITELTGHISRRSLYYSKSANGEYSIVKFSNEQGNVLQRRSEHTYNEGTPVTGPKCVICGSSDALDAANRSDMENYAYTFIHDEEVFDMKFDVIVGNPPYQLEGKNENRDIPIYQHFVNKAMALEPKYLSFIIPARWYVGGMGLGEFRSSMLSDRRIRALVDFPNAAEVFPGVEIKGGVCYFLWDRDYDGMCEVSNVMSGETVMTADRVLDAEDVFVRFNQAVSVLEKVRVRNEETLVGQVSSGVPFGVRTNFSDFKDEPFTDAVALYARGRIGYVEEEKLSTNREWIPKWKVFISNAYGAGEGYPHQILGKPVVAPPGSACTQTYLVAGVFDTEDEAENLAAYMRTRFFRYLVSLRKTTQHASQGVYAFVPKLDMRHRWTDQELYERYDLDADEVGEIKSKIKEMVS